MTNDPASAGKALGAEPSIHRTASVRASTFGRYCEVGARTKVAESHFGDYSYVVNDSDIIYTTLGKFCSIAAHTRINPGNHPLDRVMLSHVSYRSSAYGLGPDDSAFFDWRRSTPVTMGHDVWIGHGAVVLPGISIGTGAAIGAGSIVTKDVPPFAVVVGNPGSVLRLRFAERVVADLLEIAWWDWPHAKLGTAMNDFRTLGAEAFCAKYRGC
ncbi:MAG TPA: DapH/DapD/GlmU-related protein [Acetobacteraceae bacterium]|nr:DapH/DapD/GlmU-related protein [Acetobacteraceae bacterium]